ncbi:MAG: hypothetical protein MMC33_000554 [Icmadophila ericetorum]|nr:hypothetical protein [Icmadophila ericetorum]
MSAPSAQVYCDAFLKVHASRAAEVKDFLENQVKISEWDLEEAWTEFSSEEILASGMPIAHPVHPSGSPKANVGIMLHYPTFYTDKKEFGETADTISSCTELLNKGIPVGNFFWFEKYFRRTKATPRRNHALAKDWDDLHRLLHEDFSQGFVEKTAIKVLAVFGAENRISFRKQYKLPKEVQVDLPGGVQVLSNLLVDKGWITQIAVYCPRPEKFFSNMQNGNRRLHDAAINLVMSLGGIGGILLDYFLKYCEDDEEGRACVLSILIELRKSEKNRARAYELEELPQRVLQWSNSKKGDIIFTGSETLQIEAEITTSDREEELENTTVRRMLSYLGNEGNYSEAMRFSRLGVTPKTRVSKKRPHRPIQPHKIPKFLAKPKSEHKARRPNAELA